MDVFSTVSYSFVANFFFSKQLPTNIEFSVKRAILICAGFLSYENVIC